MEEKEEEEEEEEEQDEEEEEEEEEEEDICNQLQIIAGVAMFITIFQFKSSILYLTKPSGEHPLLDHR